MEDNDRIWTLMGKKLAGEISKNEQVELDSLLISSQTTFELFSLLSKFWKSNKNNCDRKIDQEAFIKHVARMSKKGI